MQHYLWVKLTARGLPIANLLLLLPFRLPYTPVEQQLSGAVGRLRDGRGPTGPNWRALILGRVGLDEHSEAWGRLFLDIKTSPFFPLVHRPLLLWYNQDASLFFLLYTVFFILSLKKAKEKSWHTHVSTLKAGVVGLNSFIRSLVSEMWKTLGKNM